MILLVSGATTVLAERRHSQNLGHLVVPKAQNRLEALLATGLPIAADNGCYGGLDEPKFIAMLTMLRKMVRSYRRPLWVTVPDKVGDADETLVLWRWYHHYVRGSDLPMAFVAQDGAESRYIPWYKIDCLFIGGSTQWKEGEAAASLIKQAKWRGKWVHVGRVNTLRRERMFQALDVDSIDGSQYSRFSKTYIPDADERLTYRQRGLF